MKRPIFVTLLAVLSALGQLNAAETQHPTPAHGGLNAPTKTFKNVGVAEFEKLRAGKTNVVLDVRTPAEYAAGHIPGAVNIDVTAPDFDKKVGALDASKTYLVHCKAGTRSARACEKLEKLNFGKLYNLEGGVTAWEKAGHKTEK
ncbi:MAG: rhodanese-like domain-containing protein [Verrucomicrobiota bacterium]